MKNKLLHVVLVSSSINNVLSTIDVTFCCLQVLCIWFFVQSLVRFAYFVWNISAY